MKRYILTTGGLSSTIWRHFKAISELLKTLLHTQTTVHMSLTFYDVSRNDVQKVMPSYLGRRSA